VHLSLSLSLSFSLFLSLSLCVCVCVIEYVQEEAGAIEERQPAVVLCRSRVLDFVIRLPSHSPLLFFVEKEEREEKRNEER